MEGCWFLKCLCGRRDSAHLGDGEVYMPFHTIGAAYSGGSCVNIDFFCNGPLSSNDKSCTVKMDHVFLVWL